MARKKTAIGELIKSDMSRRTIGEEHEIITEPAASPTASKPSTAGKPLAESKPAAAHKETPKAAPPAPEGSASKGCGSSPAAPAFMAAIAAQAQSAGLTDESDLGNLYAFLQSQALRYIKGFDAARRFHG